MTLGIIGLGRMGQSIAARLLYAGIDVVGYDAYASQELDLRILPVSNKQICMVYTPEKATKTGAFKRVQSLAELIQQVTVYWLMVPAGDVVDQLLKEMVPIVPAGAIIIDGGNSFFKDSVRRFQWLQEHGISFLDCGTSGGLQGRNLGFCLMIGGEKNTFTKCEQFFKALAAPAGYSYLGPAGAGHYVKMVHNGIEYGLLQAYAEGFQILKEGSYKELDVAAIAAVWNQGSIIRSWLLELTKEVLDKDPVMSTVSGAIAESGMGQWTVEEAQSHGVPVQVIAQALRIRAESRQTGGTHATKLVALLRNAFGGHAVSREK